MQPTEPSLGETSFKFTFSSIESQLKFALDCGYRFIPCADYVSKKNKLSGLTIVSRVDVDFSLRKAKQLAMVFNSLGIKSSFFIRLHAKEYNPFGFEEYRILKFIRDSGHEIGCHSEVIDQSVIWNEDPEACLKRDIQFIETLLSIKVLGVASHGGLTGLNNLDFWNKRKPKDFGLLYEAYDKESEFNLFYESLYISDSNWIDWKCYKKGNLVSGDTRSLGEHLKDKPSLIYLLTHPDTFYTEHFYE